LVGPRIPDFDHIIGVVVLVDELPPLIRIILVARDCADVGWVLAVQAEPGLPVA
jgi:hypothetical protein